ncbi:hypothetical protein CVV68_12985 [Arthrobacter livingstonensis]|uniref:DUF2087 domain-containing protein n=1 Tax=Arthrobacter livingstonensis TaxID=670078 RepID=A0A2V5L5R2_9MICC|nr:DUF2087 domain-containing protein [Arthrobacter livingstonensis]PYI66719.1 hypothetical protein CVV68_12985 [Arthrobacter livingstonensis]
MTGDNAIPWQPVMAALANEQVLQVYAARVLGVDGPAFEKELRRLASVGLLTPGTYEPVAGVFDTILVANSAPKAEGIDKFFSSGMLTQLPMNPALRREVLEHLATRLIPEGETLGETDINRLLATVTTDIPTLRRALVDHGLLERNADGSAYRRR